MINLFISYSHKDEEMRVELEKHLSLLKRNKIIDTWHGRRILPGEDFSNSINTHLKAASVILLLISADFLHSDYCYEIEMQEAMRMHEQGRAVVIPVILRPCAWQDGKFGKLLVLPQDGKAVSTYLNPDLAYLDITNGIKANIKHLHTSLKGNAKQPADKAETEIPGNIANLPRSTNLTIKKIFSDHQKDKFLRESFELMAKYFEGSLKELEKHNPEISFVFNRIDSQSFAATIYRNGKKECEGMIFTGSTFLSKGISYSNRVNLAKDSLNESMQVTDNGFMLLLKPLGMSPFRTINNSEITAEGAAEFYWQMLIERLQR
jgi:hypothetical protein